MKIWQFLSGIPPPEPNDYARLIIDNLPYIEKQCRRAADSTRGDRSEVDIDNEADLANTL